MQLSKIAPPPLPTSNQLRAQRKAEDEEDEIDASMAYQDDEPMPAEEHIG